MAKKKVVLEIDVTDWGDEYLEEEPNLSTEDEAIKTAIAGGYLPAQMARLIIVGRMRGEAGEGLIRPNKTLLMVGGA